MLDVDVDVEVDVVVTSFSAGSSVYSRKTAGPPNSVINGDPSHVYVIVNTSPISTAVSI